MTKSKSAVLVEIKKPLEIIEIEIPKLNPGQVLVKIIETGICRSQILEIDGGRDNKKWLPHMLGHEGVGIVVDKANDVAKVNINDKVVLTWIECSGLFGGSTKYNSEIGFINAGPITTFSQYSVISENRLFKINENITEELAPLLGCAIPTGCGIVLNEINIADNDKVCILGLGGIGISALITLLSINLKNITVFDIDDKKLKLAHSMGVTNCVNLNKIDASQFKGLFDKVIEAAGTIKTIEMGFSFLKNKGHLVFASHPPKNKKISIDPHELISGKRISGSWGGGCNPEIEKYRLNDLFSKKIDVIKKIKSKKYTLDNINTAIYDFKNQNCFRPIITPNK